ncbi:MAG TPA: DUF1015 family protein [Euzebyales bacterium]
MTVRLGIRPAHLHVVAPGVASRVAAPAYDTLPAWARAHRARDPLSFLHVLRAADSDPDRRRNRRALERLLRGDVFDAGTGPRFAWYRLTTPDGHIQTGLVAEVAIRDYDDGRIIRHEHTRADREERLAAFQQAVPADASPVGLAFRADARLRALQRRATAMRPHVDFTSHDGTEHAIWTTSDPAVIGEVQDALATIDRLYVTDGHHRLAAASRVAADGRAAGADVDAPDQWVLAALFPDDELRILPFHRAVTRPHGMTTERLVAMIASHIAVEPVAAAGVPAAPHTFLAWVDGGWYRLRADVGAIGDAPLDALDVTVLQRQVLEPALGVHEPRLDPRLTYVAGDADAVVEHCRRTQSIGFMLRPTSMAELMRVADADSVMPPKSTLFSPKTCAGVVLRLTE